MNYQSSKRQTVNHTAEQSGYGSTQRTPQRSAGSAENTGRPMSDELINERGRQRRQRPTGISFDSESGRNTHDDEYYSAPRAADPRRKNGGTGVNASAKPTAARKDAFDLSYGEDESEEKLRKMPKTGSSSRPVVISAMILAAVMLTVIIYAVVSKNRQNNVSGSDITYHQPKTVTLKTSSGKETIDTTTYTVELTGKGIVNIDDLYYCFLLKTLILSDNQIADITALGNCTSLQTLDLSTNEISNIKPLTKVVSLSDLSLHNNHVQDISPLSDMTGMERLDISYNEIETIDVLENMTSLRQLNAANNRIASIASLANMTNLNTLELGTNNISDISALTNLTKLSTLDLSNNEQVSGLSALSGLTNLDTLDLSGNYHVNNIEPLMGLQNLLSLDLTDTDVSDEDIARLKEALPNCTVIR